MNNAFEIEPVEVIPQGQQAVTMRPTAGLIRHRDKLIKSYHSGSGSLVERIRKTTTDDAQSRLVILIDEVIQETDHLLGNELVATEEGNLRDASAISAKRAEVLSMAIKAVQSKQEFEKAGGVDVDSPSMVTTIRFFMSKCNDAFEAMGTAGEVKDLFMRTMGVVMENWKKELIEALSNNEPPRGRTG